MRCDNAGMTTTAEKPVVRAMIWMNDAPENGTGALNIGRETATLHPDTVLEETAPGQWQMTNPGLPVLPGEHAPAMQFDSTSRGVATDGTGRQFNILALLFRLRDVPRGEAVALWT